MLDRTYVRTSIAPIHPFYDPPIETERLTLVACPAETLRVLFTDRVRTPSPPTVSAA
jgi:hypothetical protein